LARKKKEMADFRARWEGYFKALDANSNGFLEPQDALLCAEVCMWRVLYLHLFIYDFFF
jgi:hypothetical protein